MFVQCQNLFNLSIFAVFNHYFDLHCGQEMQYEMDNGERLVRAISVRIVSRELLTS